MFTAGPRLVGKSSIDTFKSFSFLDKFDPFFHSFHQNVQVMFIVQIFGIDQGWRVGVDTLKSEKNKLYYTFN